MKTTSKTSRRHEAYTPAAMREGLFYSDLGNCGTRSLGWVDAHDPTPAASPAQATCLLYHGTEYFATGKTGTRYDDGTACREFASEADARLWVDAHGRIQAD